MGLGFRVVIRTKLPPPPVLPLFKRGSLRVLRHMQGMVGGRARTGLAAMGNRAAPLASLGAKSRMRVIASM